MACTGFAEPITTLVPALSNESNFNVWNTSLRWALDARDIKYYRLLTGSYPKPGAVDMMNASPSRIEACRSWENTSRQLLPLLNATVHPTIRHYILDAPDAHAAYEILSRAFGAQSHQPSQSHHSNLATYTRFVNLIYDSNSPRAFVKEWRLALEELQKSVPTKFPPVFVFYQFFVAVSDNPATQKWFDLDQFLSKSEGFTTTGLERIFSLFISLEEKRLNDAKPSECWGSREDKLREKSSFEDFGNPFLTNSSGMDRTGRNSSLSHDNSDNVSVRRSKRHSNSHKTGWDAHRGYGFGTL
ncbi:hypothetical protein N7457_006380 [Penicillium paradoxum]|uniref:uncharacterized protein n=1 Tax=Penicillium paradoxum TaxID=176176 RepID=UPI0025489AFF|nr:uncharacterized protein N7457_006380 [Penicillium paradoxum]KAJ5781220.1 hypothetical protein N7457_006380 [Penicillium paradoxum]